MFWVQFHSCPLVTVSGIWWRESMVVPLLEQSLVLCEQTPLCLVKSKEGREGCEELAVVGASPLFSKTEITFSFSVEKTGSLIIRRKERKHT